MGPRQTLLSSVPVSVAVVVFGVQSTWARRPRALQSYLLTSSFPPVEQKETLPGRFQIKFSFAWLDLGRTPEPITVSTGFGDSGWLPLHHVGQIPSKPHGLRSRKGMVLHGKLLPCGQKQEMGLVEEQIKVSATGVT